MKISKKILGAVLTVALMLSLMSVATFTASAETEGDFEYAVANGEATVTDYTGTAEHITVPDTLGGYPVTTIGERTFDGYTNMQSVRLPSTLKTIEKEAFFSCFDLRDILLPDSLTYIGESAFFGCDSLTSVVIPQGVTYLGVSALASCESLEEVTVPNSVKTMGWGAFYSDGIKTVHFVGTRGQWNLITVIGSSGFVFGAMRDNQDLLYLPETAAVLFEAGANVPGDADEDGEVTMKDVLMIRKYIAKIGVCDNLENADYDGDDVVTMKDVLAIRKEIAGIA